jgi:hypothetical protein
LGQVVYADRALVAHAVAKVYDGDVVLTYAFSSVVLEVLLQAHARGRRFRVVVLDSRPELEGRALLRCLMQVRGRGGGVGGAGGGGGRGCTSGQAAVDRAAGCWVLDYGAMGLCILWWGLLLAAGCCGAAPLGLSWRHRAGASRCWPGPTPGSAPRPPPLPQAGIQCSYCLITALSYIMPEVTKVLLGAAAVLSNGTVISRAGAAAVAMMAAAGSTPVGGVAGCAAAVAPAWPMHW